MTLTDEHKAALARLSLSNDQGYCEALAFIQGMHPKGRRLTVGAVKYVATESEIRACFTNEEAPHEVIAPVAFVEFFVDALDNAPPMYFKISPR